MILIVDLSYRPGSLLLDEFVAPVERMVRQEGYPTQIRHYTGLSRADIVSSDGAILCGTALADFGYLEGLEMFDWLLSFPCPVLGICAGMQVLVRVYGGELYPATGIGMADQKVVAPDPLLAGKDRFPAYELHSLSVVPPPPFTVLATSLSGAQVIRHRESPVYGVMFHPEVRNEWLIRRFLSLCLPGAGSTHDPIDDDGEGQADP
jgi:GMP synthase (glutamine-hydrolysing)